MALDRRQSLPTDFDQDAGQQQDDHRAGGEAAARNIRSPAISPDVGACEIDRLPASRRSVTLIAVFPTTISTRGRRPRGRRRLT